MDRHMELELQRQIRELEDRVHKLESGETVIRCTECGIDISDLFSFGSAISGIVCSRADCPQKAYDGSGTGGRQTGQWFP